MLYFVCSERCYREQSPGVAGSIFSQKITDLAAGQKPADPQGCVEELVHFLNSFGKPHTDHNSKDTLWDLQTPSCLLQALFLCYLLILCCFFALLVILLFLHLLKYLAHQTELWHGVSSVAHIVLHSHFPSLSPHFYSKELKRDTAL